MAARSLPAPTPPAVPGDVCDPAAVRLLPGVQEACRRLRRAGFVLVIISNQGVVARGGASVEQVQQVNARLCDLLAEGGDELIEAAYWCPFHPQGRPGPWACEHPWRKPGGQMILAAADNLDLDLSRSWMVGDSERDVAAGLAAGIARERCLRVGQGGDVPDLAAAAERILRCAAGPYRVLVVMPSWVGDAVMATPALAALRAGLPETHVGALVRPGIDELLDGTGLVDECHVVWPGLMAPRRAAVRVMPSRYDAALLLTNSFSSALAVFLARIPRRVGYARDGRGLLLTDRLVAPRRADGRWAPIPAVNYYRHVVRRFLDPSLPPAPDPAEPVSEPMCLAVTDVQRQEADRRLTEAGVPTGVPLVLVCPGANAPAKRWPAERFAEVARHVAGRWGACVLVSGSPGEREVVAQVVARARDGLNGPAGRDPHEMVVDLASTGLTPGLLKGIIARCVLCVCNDTGPRHMAAALGVPVVALFGPTDPRWTTVVAPAGQVLLRADPDLPRDHVADDHPQRCRIDRIGTEAVLAAAARWLNLAVPDHQGAGQQVADGGPADVAAGVCAGVRSDSRPAAGGLTGGVAVLR